MSITGHTLTITWHDFGAPVPAAARNDAFTSTTYRVRTNFTMRVQQGRQFDFRLSTVTIQVILNRAQMWSRASARRADLLKHEQGHYDITALVMRDLHTDLTALIQAAQTFPTQQALEQAVADLQDPAVAMVESLQSTPTADGLYDQQTGHGRTTSAQRKWNAAVVTARSNSATRFADALSSQGIMLP